MSHSLFQSSGRARLSCVSLGTLLANVVGTSVLSIVAVPVAFAAAPTCNGLTATIYVDVGDIIVSTVPGDNGDPYTGTLTGTSGADVIVGTTGADTITGANNDDTICGLDGADVIDAGNGNNWVDAGDGTNQVTSGTGNDTIFSGPGDDTITTGNGTNVVNAGEGNNTVTGGTGIDTITTGGGNDTIIASNGNNVIDAGEGNNSITAGTGDDTVTTGNGNNTINVGNGNNTVTTGNGSDSVTGGTGVDTFNLGGGNDFCTTGNGADVVTSCEANGNEGVVTIVKDTTPDTPGQSFGYTGTVGTFSLAGEASQVIVLSGGIIYTAIETAVPGWTLDTITCTADVGTSGAVGTATATINLQQGDFITCTFASSQTSVATTTTLVSDLNPSVVSNSVTFTATVEGAAPTGTVSFKDGVDTIGTGTLVAMSSTGSQATFATSALAVGSHNITATYNGDGGNLTSTSAPVLVQVVNQSATTTVTLSAPNPSIIGTNVDFAAQIAGVAPTGITVFYDGTTNIGTGTLMNATSTGAQAFLTTNVLTVGSHNITAVYQGDTNNLLTASPAVLVQVVDPTATTTVTVSAPNPSYFSQNVDFSVQITGFNPTGTVKFYDGLLEIAGSTVSVVNATSTGAQAFYSTTGLAVGSHDITAVYSGDSNNLETASPTLHVHVVDVAPTTTVVLSSLDPSVFGDTVTFTATVTGVGPTGTVSFKDGVDTIGTGTLVALSATGSQATFATAAMTAGVHSITASYSGDGNNGVSTSAILSQDVDQAPTTTTLEILPSPIDVGDDVTFTATVSGVSPTGTVTFSSNGAAFATVAIDGSGVAVFTSIGSAVGDFNIIATYNGDSNHLTSSAEGQILKVLSGNGRASRFAHLVRYLTNQGSLFGNLPPGSFGGSPIGNSDLSAEQLNVICGLQDSVESMNARRTVEMLGSIYGQLWNIDPALVRAALQDESLCGGEEAVEEEEAEASTNATVVTGIVPVDSEGVPLSTDPVWNACIRQFELRLPGELKPLNCRKYHEGHLWEHPDLLVNIKFYDRHAQKLELPRGFIAVKVASATEAAR